MIEIWHEFGTSKTPKRKDKIIYKIGVSNID